MTQYCRGGGVPVHDIRQGKAPAWGGEAFVHWEKVTMRVDSCGRAQGLAYSVGVEQGEVLGGHAIGSVHQEPRRARALGEQLRVPAHVPATCSGVGVSGHRVRAAQRHGRRDARNVDDTLALDRPLRGQLRPRSLHRDPGRLVVEDQRPSAPIRAGSIEQPAGRVAAAAVVGGGGEREAGRGGVDVAPVGSHQ